MKKDENDGNVTRIRGQKSAKIFVEKLIRKKTFG
jgi:hypothetical protein